MQREKQTRSGALLEIDLYPVTTAGRRLPERAAKCKPSTAQQKRYNQAKSTKRLIRLVNANFDGSDYFLHPTYQPGQAPQTEEEAKRDMVNYLRRIKARRQTAAKQLQAELKELGALAKENPGNATLERAVQECKGKLPKVQQPLRYIYVLEKQVYKTGERRGQTSWHFHLFISGGLDAAEMEKAWGKGMRTNCNRYQPEKFGPAAAAMYISKDPQGSKRFCCSLTLKKPQERVKKGMSGRRVEQIAKQRVDDAAWWEQRYPGYRFLQCYSRLNEYNGRWYVSAVMYRTESNPPPWDNWDMELLF